MFVFLDPYKAWLLNKIYFVILEPGFLINILTVVGRFIDRLFYELPKLKKNL